MAGSEFRWHLADSTVPMCIVRDFCFSTQLPKREEYMTMSISNQGASNQAVRNTDQLDVIMQAIETALYHPSLKGISWDDELLPSGD
jgi:hypothetical protein